jgi:hypothetical protein
MLDVGARIDTVFQCLLRLCVFCEHRAACSRRKHDRLVSVPSQALCVLRGPECGVQGDPDC